MSEFGELVEVVSAPEEANEEQVVASCIDGPNVHAELLDQLLPRAQATQWRRCTNPPPEPGDYLLSGPSLVNPGTTWTGVVRWDGVQWLSTFRTPPTHWMPLPDAPAS